MADQNTSKNNGLDMKSTIEFYVNRDLYPINPSREEVSMALTNPERIGLSREEISGLIALFPEAARERSTAREIKGKPQTWFDKKSKLEDLILIPTEDFGEAISPTAIVPSRIDYEGWKADNPTAQITLYELSRDIPERTRKTILAEGLVHEFAHSIIARSIYTDEMLVFPDGSKISGIDAILKFAQMTEPLKPISHYASTYRDAQGKFLNTKKVSQETSINEELAETITAHLLGFAFCGDDARGLNPFSDRPEVRKFVEDYLNARREK